MAITVVKSLTLQSPKWIICWCGMPSSRTCCLDCSDPQLCSPARLTLGKTNRVIYAERFRRLRMNDRFDKWQMKNEKWRPKNGSQILEAFLPRWLLEVPAARLGSWFILVTSLFALFFTLRQPRPSGLLCRFSHNRATRGHSSISVRACRQQCLWCFWIINNLFLLLFINYKG